MATLKDLERVYVEERPKILETMTRQRGANIAVVEDAIQDTYIALMLHPEKWAKKTSWLLAKTFWAYARTRVNDVKKAAEVRLRYAQGVAELIQREETGRAAKARFHE